VKRNFSVDETRETFLGFFEKNGHARIPPYPVIARWREDLFVTIASIADFQPYVTEGIIPPPANPLVISQPCLRFSDVDNVGLTAGRHFVIFEMGGAHAFNYPDKSVYWKDDTVRYHHRFVTEAFGVDSRAITYKEGVWSGGIYSGCFPIARIFLSFHIKRGVLLRDLWAFRVNYLSAAGTGGGGFLFHYQHLHGKGTARR
jgi:alanyl-tRNA synthetase